MISSPKAFVHVAHVGINEKGVVEASKGLDPVWATLVGELKGHGVNNNIIQNNIDFIGGFLEGTKVSRSRTATGEGRESMSMVSIQSPIDYLGLIADKERSEKIRGKRATR